RRAYVRTAAGSYEQQDLETVPIAPKRAVVRDDTVSHFNRIATSGCGVFASKAHGSAVGRVSLVPSKLVPRQSRGLWGRKSSALVGPRVALQSNVVQTTRLSLSEWRRRREEKRARQREQNVGRAQRMHLARLETEASSTIKPVAPI